MNKTEMEEIITEICLVPVEDNISFRITDVETIMEDFDYPEIRIHLMGLLERLKQPVKIDISTDDAITPRAIEYKYPLLFEEREIYLHTYNTETLLAEKSQTIINRGIANTRMRDFYDLYEIVNKLDFSWETYCKAFFSTCKKRGTVFQKENVEAELERLSISEDLEERWNQFKNKNYFVQDIEYAKLIKCISATIMKIYE